MIDISKWRDYSHINTSSLWHEGRRASHSSHKGDYHGNFIPQIPAQFIERFSSEGDFVLDVFCGSGTTLIECKEQGRHGVGFDINADAIELTKERVKAAGGTGTAKVYMQDCLGFGKQGLGRIDLMKKYKDRFQLTFVHPPYHDIIRFNPGVDECLSEGTLDSFLSKMTRLAHILNHVTKEGGYVILVIGDKYTGGELVTLGFDVANIFKSQFLLKAVVVKNMAGNEKAKNKNKNLWRYRHLKNGTFDFSHEYVFVFKKV